jgi:hypothetical protein
VLPSRAVYGPSISLPSNASALGRACYIRVDAAGSVASLPSTSGIALRRTALCHPLPRVSPAVLSPTGLVLGLFCFGCRGAVVY